MAHQGYGFCEFLTEEDAEYACKIMNQIKLFGKPIRVNKVSVFSYGLELHYISQIQASSDKKQLDVGANLFVGNLDENVDERLLYDTFSAFGMMATTAKVSAVFLRMVRIMIIVLDCPRPELRKIQRLWFRIVHRL